MNNQTLHIPLTETVKKLKKRRVKPVVGCSVCQRGHIWQESVARTVAAYQGQPVKDGKEVVDYLLVEVAMMLEHANDKLVCAADEARRL